MQTFVEVAVNVVEGRTCNALSYLLPLEECYCTALTGLQHCEMLPSMQTCCLRGIAIK